MKKILLGLFLFGLTTQINAQTIELSEVELSVNYKYLNATQSEEAAVPVKKLVDKLLACNEDNTDVFVDDNGEYCVSFYIPEGRIVAAFNNEGKILRTFEKYENIRLPLEVLQNIATNYPNWSIAGNTYLVSFHCDKGLTKKLYKIRLENEDKVLNIKTDEKGLFL
ncbi:nicotinate-nucleotide adenylyltransferase [Yeosuana marina]|uniref:nicotinate-nucleotide adenylyltransferase n=1 Tax=Yeosuana marina TaxID=1565536 RepID=UPI00142104C6|nr:nicotinate-nucleotide adenylyltransferase [Yeosuana marina]